MMVGVEDYELGEEWSEQVEKEEMGKNKRKKIQATISTFN